MKAILVDDEDRQRNALLKYTNWERYDISIIASVDNADSAICIASENVPDILITDIRLIGKSGLELAREIRTINEDLVIILMTGYHDFEYAKKAVDLHVEAFILKPIDYKEFENLLEKVNLNYEAGQNEKEKALSAMQQIKDFEQILTNDFFRNIIKGYNEKTKKLFNDEENSFFQGEVNYLVAVFAQESSLLDSCENRNEVSIAFDIDKIKKMVAKEFELYFRTAFLINEEVIVVIFSKVDSNFEKTFKQKLDNIITQTEGVLLSRYKVGVGNAVDKLEHVSSSYNNAITAVYQMIIDDEKSIFVFDDEIKFNYNTDIRLENLGKQFINSIKKEDLEKSSSIITNIIEILIVNYLNNREKIINFIIDIVSSIRSEVETTQALFLPNFSYERNIYRKVMGCPQIIDMIKAIKETLIEISYKILVGKRSRQYVLAIEIINYIGNNLNEIKSLQQVADHFFLSSSYIGAIIRAEIGKSFTEYLFDLRIENSKSLLKNRELKIYEIANMIGYKDSAYFCTQFKKVVGMSPSKYRNLSHSIDLNEKNKI